MSNNLVSLEGYSIKVPGKQQNIVLVYIFKALLISEPYSISACILDNNDDGKVN